MGLSYSTLNDYLRCPQLYRLKHIDKVPVEFETSGDMAFGSAMHSGLQALLEGDSGEQSFLMYWDSIKGKPYPYGRFNWEALREMGPQFLERFERLHLKHLTPFNIEQRLYAKAGGHDIEGTPDLLGAYKGIPSVIDFKTSAQRYDRAKIVVNGQMPIYSYMATQQAEPYTPQQRVYFVFVKANLSIQTLTLPISPEEILKAADLMAAWADTIRDDKKYLQNTSGCLMGSYKCNYFTHCWGKEEETGE